MTIARIAIFATTALAVVAGSSIIANAGSRDDPFAKLCVPATVCLPRLKAKVAAKPQHQVKERAQSVLPTK